jgi:Big-like domain-containing protein
MRKDMTIRGRDGARWLGIAGMVVVLLMARGAHAASVAINSPSDGASVSGSVTINTSIGSSTVWINVYVDGHYFASGPPSSFTWNSATVSDGGHTISAKAYVAPGDSIGSDAVSINVSNSGGGSSPVSNGYYFSTGGSDSNPCTQGSPCRSLGKAQELIAGAGPGDGILFQRGGTWYGGITMPLYVSGSSGQPVTIGNYGSGPLPVIDGGGSAAACVYAKAWGRSSTPLWSYITVDGLECRNTTQYGVVFSQQAGGSAGMPGIVVKNMNIHDTGPSYDDGNYRNQLMFKDENQRYDGVQFLNNSVTSCGGHNCIQVQSDVGHPLISGNYCAGWHHNCIDVKSVVGAVVRGNTVNGYSAWSGAAFYLENTQIPAADVTWERNIVYGPVDGFECEWGGANSGVSSTCRIYNNTAYLGDPSAVVTGGDSSCGDVTLDVRNNIFDTAFTYYNGHGCTTPYWDYNDDGGTHSWAHGPTGPHDMVGVDPMYVNAGSQNFKLQSASPCLGAGVSGLPSGLSNMGAW